MTTPHPPITVAGRTLLEEIDRWGRLAAEGEPLPETVTIAELRKIVAHVLPAIEAEAAALATSREPAFPPIVEPIDWPTQYIGEIPTPPRRRP